MPESFHLSHFLKERHIKKAIELLSQQLSQTSPLYNNLDFTLYRIEGISQINPGDFYENYVAKDAFYYFENLFYSKTYFSIQRAYKIREFHYLSLPAGIIYYSIGFYIRELLNDAISLDAQVHAAKPMHIYYGGKINYDTPSVSQIFYYEDYRDFLVQKEVLTKPVNGKKLFAISLDIKSFFYTINHRTLLEIIEAITSSIAKKKYLYDEDTKRSILVFFELLQSDQMGLPVSNQNLISSFLSSIYLSVLDRYVLTNYVNNKGFKYMRYVDDFYLIFSTDDSIEDSILREQIYDIENDIAHFLMNHLHLSVSTEKSKRFEITNIDSQIEFLKSSNLESPFDLDFDYEAIYSKSAINIDTKGKTPPEIFNECINILSVVKAKSTRTEQLFIDSNKSAFLNYILILKSCLHYSKSKAAADVMDKFQIFDNISAIDYLLIKPKVLLHLITVNKKNRNILLEFLLKALKHSSSILPKLTLLDKFIHQMFFLISEAKEPDRSKLQQEFSIYKAAIIPLLTDLKKKLEPIEYLNLIECALNGKLPENSFIPTYTCNFLNNGVAISLMQQIKLRRIS